MRKLTSLIFALLILLPLYAVEAGNTRSVNRGEAMRPLTWSIANSASNCTPYTTYTGSDGIASRWTSTPRSSAGGTELFTALTVGAAAGTYTFRCVLDSNPAILDQATLVVCDNVTQESDGGAACVAKTPATPTGLTATPSATCGSGQINLSWNSVPGAVYSVRDGATVIYSGAATSYSHTGLTAGSAHSYTVRAQNGALNSAYSAVVNATAPAVCTYPNLVVAATTFPPGTTLYQNTSYTLSGTVQNTGPQNAGAFSNNFSYNPNGTGWGNPSAPAGYVSKAGLAAGATASADTYTFTPTFLGTVQLQYCVDSYAAINEGSLAAEGDNCVQSPTTYNVVVAPPSAPTGLTLNTSPVPACGGRITADWNDVPGATSYEVSVNGGAYIDIGGTSAYQFNSLVPGTSYTISVRAKNSTDVSAASSASASASAACNTFDIANCAIPIQDNSRTCTAVITAWDITGAVVPNIYNLTRSQAVPGTNTVTGSNVPVTIERSVTLGNAADGANTIQARDGSTVLRSRTINAQCEAESFFHIDNAVNSCKPKPSIISTPNPAWIRSGDQATLTFAILANYPGVSCDIVGGVSAGTVINHTESPTRTNHTIVTNPLTAAQNVRITCNAPGLSPAVTGQVRVNVLPEVEEI